MKYKKFKEILYSTIFRNSKRSLIEKIAKSPKRYTGIFRPTKPKMKLLQNLLQSHEIRFGDAFETLIGEYIKEQGYEMLERKFSYGGKRWDVDQLFTRRTTIFLVEQKIRDDHDSSKIVGQMDNFEKKVLGLLEKYPTKKINGFVYFIDDSFKKNSNYYSAELERISDEYSQLSLRLCYGEELFAELGCPNLWREILQHLERWHAELPDITEVDFDKDPQDSYAEIKDLSPTVYRKLLGNENLTEILRVLFPKAATLELLAEWFQEQYQHANKNKYKGLSELCQQSINNIKG